MSLEKLHASSLFLLILKLTYSLKGKKSVDFSIKMQPLQCKAIIITVFTQPEEKTSLNSDNQDENYIRRVLIL